VRRVQVVRGTVAYRLCCKPAFDYGRVSHTVSRGAGEDTSLFESKAMTLQLSAHTSTLKDPVKPIRWWVEEETVTYETAGGLTVSLPRLCAKFELGEHQDVVFVLHEPGGGEKEHPTAQYLSGLQAGTNSFWRDWLRSCSYRGRWREMVLGPRAKVDHLCADWRHHCVSDHLAAGVAGRQRELGLPLCVAVRRRVHRVCLLRVGLTEEANGFMGWIE
jgi:hypothetical protein